MPPKTLLRSMAKRRYHGADLSDEAQIADMMRYAESEFGGVDILINNAGIQHVSPMEKPSRLINGTRLSRLTSPPFFHHASGASRYARAKLGAHH